MSLQSTLALARAEILALKSYDNLRNSTPADAVILDSNENIASPSHELTQEKRFRYPQIRPQQLVERLATIYQVRPEQIMLGRGSDDVIDSLCRVFCRAGQDAILQTIPCFSMYAISAQIQGAEVVDVALLERAGFAYDVDAILSSITNKVKLIFLATPQSPTGKSLSENDLIKLLKATENRCIVVLDEAYIEFSSQTSKSHLLDEYANLIIMRTLSKAYGLANLRCGVMMAHRDIVKLVRKVVTPYALPGVVVDAAYQALSDDNLLQIQKTNTGMHKRRERLFEMLNDLPWVTKVYSSDANFLLIKVLEVKKVISYLKKENIFVRSFSPNSSLDDCIRISVGSNSDLYKLSAVLANLTE